MVRKAHNKLTVDEFARRLAEKFGKTITLNPSTYTNTHTAAEFILTDGRTWRAIPKNVMKSRATGHKHHWTVQEVRIEASRYQYLKDFLKKSNRAYNAAIKLGILEEIKSKMISGERKKVSLLEFKVRLKKVHGDILRINATSFKNMRDKALFIDRQFGEWQASPYRVLAGSKHPKRQKSEIKQKCLTHFLQRLEKVHGSRVLLDESTFALGKRQKARFIDADHGPFWGRRDQVLEGSRHRNASRWTEKELRKLASSFSSRTRFLKAFPAAYKAARERGVLEKICKHMGRPYSEGSNRERSWSLYQFVWLDGAVYVGITNRLEARCEQHFRDKKSAVFRHCRKTGFKPKLEILRKGLISNTASKLEEQLIQELRRDGKTILNSAKGGSTGAKRKYTVKELIAIAREYPTIKEWATANESAYKSALQRGIKKQCTAHMAKKKVLSLAAAKKRGKKFRTQKEWLGKDRASYNVVAKAGLLSQVIPLSRRKWDLEKALEEGKKYTCRKDWLRSSGQSYRVVEATGMLDLVMPARKRQHTLESAMAEGGKYGSRKEWQEKDQYTLALVRKSGRLDDVLPSKQRKWTDELVLAEMKKYRTKREWSKKSPGSYEYYTRHKERLAELDTSKDEASLIR